jgi:hypothetical protein
MIKFIKNLFKSTKQQSNIPVVSKRFPFGEPLEHNGKTYRYLYTYGENDVLLRDDDEPRIFFINCKYIVADF